MPKSLDSRMLLLLLLLLKSGCSFLCAANRFGQLHHGRATDMDILSVVLFLLCVRVYIYIFRVVHASERNTRAPSST